MFESTIQNRLCKHVVLPTQITMLSQCCYVSRVVDLLLTPGKVHFKKRALKFSDIWTGQYVTYAQARETGDIYAWGLNNYYQLGEEEIYYFAGLEISHLASND